MVVRQLRPRLIGLAVVCGIVGLLLTYRAAILELFRIVLSPLPRLEVRLVADDHEDVEQKSKPEHTAGSAEQPDHHNEPYSLHTLHSLPPCRPSTVRPAFESPKVECPPLPRLASPVDPHWLMERQPAAPDDWIPKKDTPPEVKLHGPPSVAFGPPEALDNGTPREVCPRQRLEPTPGDVCPRQRLEPTPISPPVHSSGTVPTEATSVGKRGNRENVPGFEGFLGSFTCTVKQGGTIAVPEAVGKLLGSSRTLLLAPCLDDCLWLLPAADLDRYEEMLRRVPSPEDQLPALRRQFYSQAEKLTLKDGSFTIPNRLMKFAGIGEEVILIGAGDHLELWDAPTWERYLKKHREKSRETPEPPRLRKKECDSQPEQGAQQRRVL